jgi:uncharacterized protein YbaA (DUF1428 family)
VNYIDGFVIPVSTGARQDFINHANRMDKFFLDHGATRVVEGWGVDLKPGKTTDFQGAVKAAEGETVAFSWIEWPGKVTRDKAMKASENDAAMMAEPMPFDGKRMIFGGFEPIVTNGTASASDYVQGFVVPVPEARREAYGKMAQDAWSMFERYGATSAVEAWGADVPQGKQTDFYRAVKAEPGEKIVFSWMTWPSREVCDAAAEKMQSDPEMTMPEGMEMPFDGKRMIYGGFEPVVVLGDK